MTGRSDESGAKDTPSFKAMESRIGILPNSDVRVGFKSPEGIVAFVDLPKQVAVELGFQAISQGTKAHETADNPRPNVDFDVDAIAVISMLGNQSGGHVILSLHTPPGISMTTMIGPELTATLASQLNGALARMPEPPAHWKGGGLSSSLKGEPTTATKTSTYFGQEYPTDIIQILGVIVIRANLLEASLVSLLAAVGNITTPRAESIFYSTQNNRARLDLIKALIPLSGVSRDDEISKHLEKAKSIAERRNMLIHGEWEFKNDKFIVREKSSTVKQKRQDPMATLKSLHILASDYHDLTISIGITAVAIRHDRSIAKKTNHTP